MFFIKRLIAGLGHGEPAPWLESRAAPVHRRGLDAIRRRDREAAYDLFIEALSVDPEFPPTLVALGNMMLEDGELDEAIAHYEAALRYDDHFALAHHNLGIALKRRGEPERAVRHLRRATRLETDGRKRPPV
jgi:tetratricopeptide (TPR) repeat protein